jgi:trimethylamine--corrinoid protein Co-methyltransferase
MVRIARGIDDETLEREPSLFTVINSSSPLRLDTPMLEGIIQMARRNQVVVMTPFTLAGAMAPVTLAGALAQQHAEALAGLVMTQIARPGAPFVYGGFTSNVDMKSGAPAFGTPEYMKRPLSADSSRDDSHCPTAPPTPTPPIPLTPRPLTRACSRSGARSWAA